MVELDPATLISLAETNERMAAEFRAEAAQLLSDAEIHDELARKLRERAASADRYALPPCWRCYGPRFSKDSACVHCGANP